MNKITLQGPEIKPLSKGKAKQLVILLHGLGANGEDLISLAPEFQDLLPDAHFISPNAPFPCDMSPFGFQWFSLQKRDLKSMIEGANGAINAINEFIDEQMKRFDLTPDKVALVGFSQGTMMSLYSALRRKKPIAGILGYSGAFLHEDKMDKEITAKTKICLIHGNADAVVPFTAMVEAAKKMQKLEMEAEFYEMPGLGHGIDFEGIEIGKEFLGRILL